MYEVLILKIESIFLSNYMISQLPKVRSVFFDKSSVGIFYTFNYN